ASAPRRYSPRGTPRSTSRRWTTCACPRRCATTVTWTPPERSCKNMEAFGSSTSLTSSRASATSRGLDARISELLVGGSLELSPRELHRAGDVAALLPANTCVYIPSLPGLPLARTLEAIAAIRGAGLDPVPHVSARRIFNAEEFRGFLSAAVRKHGVLR